MNLKNNDIIQLTSSEISGFFEKAGISDRKRYPKILHKPGDEFNRVINFMKADSYMRPHLHPGKEKIEKMYLIKGKFAVIIFDDDGQITNITKLEKFKKEFIEIPAFVWHTYVMLSGEIVTYETMMGKYDPATWKELAKWAPDENSIESLDYLNWLKKKALE